MVKPYKLFGKRRRVSVYFQQDVTLSQVVVCAGCQIEKNLLTVYLCDLFSSLMSEKLDILSFNIVPLPSFLITITLIYNLAKNVIKILRRTQDTIYYMIYKVF